MNQTESVRLATLPPSRASAPQREQEAPLRGAQHLLRDP